MASTLAKLCLLMLLTFAGCKSATPIPLQAPLMQPPKNIVVSGPNNLALELIYIPPGSFIMGQNHPFRWLGRIVNFEISSNFSDTPARKVTITKGFYISKYKTTAEQFCAFLNSQEANALEQFIVFTDFSHIIRQDGQYVTLAASKNCAVNTVPWNGADEFCKWLSKATGRCFRLPTDAEWEYTARRSDGQSKWSEWSVSYDGVIEMYSEEGVGEWVSDYFAFRHSRKDKIDPTGPDEKHAFQPKWRKGQPIARVLRRSIHSMTERQWGYEVIGNAGVYGFRIVMEVNDVNCLPSSP